jgi:hypothetical protein
MSKANPITSPRAVRKAERKDKVLQLRLNGATLQQAADSVGVTRTQAYQYIREALHDLSQNTAMTTEEYRQIEVERLEAMERHCKANMTGKELIDALVKLHDRRVRILDLQSPQRHINMDGIDEIAFANAKDGDALERLRRARAEMAEIELAQRKEAVVPTEEVKEKFRMFVSHLAVAADNMRRRGNDEGMDMLNAAIDAIRRDAARTMQYIN